MSEIDPGPLRCKCQHDHSSGECGYVDYDDYRCSCVRMDPVVVGSKWRFQQRSPESTVEVLALRRVGARQLLHVAYETTGGRESENGLFVCANGSFPSGFIWLSDPESSEVVT